MPKYKYSAVDLQNKKVRGVMDARDVSDLRRLLRAQEAILIEASELESKQSHYRLKSNETAEFSRQLASMLGSGITLVRAMEILKDRDFVPRLQAVYSKLHADVQQGYTLSEAMRKQSKSFPELLINMYASGEASGQLERVADKMAVHYEKEHRLNSKVQLAMMYPAMLFVVTVVVVIIIFTVVLPEFFLLFEDIEIPAITRGVIALSGFLETSWYMVGIGALIAVVLIRYLLTIHSVALFVDRLKLRIVIAGKLLKVIYTARFARTLSSLYSSGVSMITALEITSTIIANKYIESQFSEVVRNVRNGELLSVAIGKIDGFDKKLSTSILIGEEAGRLDSMLDATAESFDYEAEVATGKLVQMVGPVMIVVLAVVICLIMLSVMLPIFTIYQNAGNL